MLKCKIGKDKSIRLKCEGSLREITVETLALIEEVYDCIKERDEEAAKAFRRSISGCLIAPDSPVWKEDDYER